jgi:hypothetical protein
MRYRYACEVTGPERGWPGMGDGILFVNVES